MKKELFFLPLLATPLCAYGNTHLSGLPSGIDANPFESDFEKNRNLNIEPKGAVVVPFSKVKNQITTLETNRNYVAQSMETRNKGFSTVGQLRDFNRVVQGYFDHNREFRKKNHRLFKHSKEVLASYGNQGMDLYAFEMNDLSNIVHNKSDIIFSAPSGDFYDRKGWDSITRIIKHGKLGTLIISEWDFTLSNGGSLIDKDAINFEVAGHPAILVVKEGVKGNAETILSWVGKKKTYSIQSNINVTKQNALDELAKLATIITNPANPIIPLHFSHQIPSLR